MNTISEIENHILKGLVLDEHGNWIPIADKKAVEEDFLAHLSAGKVLHEGRWVCIAEAKSAKTPTEIATAVLEMPLSAPQENRPPTAGPEAEDPVEETRSGGPDQPQSHASRDTGEFPPETKTISFEHPAGPDSDPSTTPLYDPQSGYAPETGAFMVEHLEDGQPAPPAGEPEVPNRSTTSFLLPTVSSWEQSAKKGRIRILVFGGIGIALAGVGAILILVFQLAR